MISDERLLDFCRAFSSAVRSGLCIGDAFETLAKSPGHGKLIERAAILVAGGVPLHQALDAQGIFPPVFIALVRAGEESGKVDEFLDRFADCLEVRVEFRRRIGRALIYPGFAALLAGALFMVFSLKAVPLVLEPLQSAGIPVPARAFWLTSLAQLLVERWALVLAAAAAAFLLLRSLARSGPGRKAWALAGHWLPGLRFATEQSRLYHLSTTTGLLLKAGIPVGTAMEVLLQFFQDDPIIHRRFRRASARLSQGRSLSESIGCCLPPEDLRTLELAEKAGRLDETLMRLGKSYYDRHLHRLKVLASGFKIATTVALAPLCFGLIMALLWPVFAVLGGTGGAFSGRTPFGSRAASSRRPPGGAGSTGAGAALFNETHAKEIVEFMKKHAPKKDSAGAGPLAERSWTPKRLGPTPQLKRIQFQNIQPTPIRATDAADYGNIKR